MNISWKLFLFSVILLEEEKTNSVCYVTSLAEVKITQISLFSNTNWKNLSPTPAPLWFVRDVSLLFSLSHNWCICIHNHLDHKVLLDLGVLQVSLVSQELPRKEPPLAGHVNVLLFLQLFLELANGICHAGGHMHVFSWEADMSKKKMWKVLHNM